MNQFFVIDLLFVILKFWSKIGLSKSLEAWQLIVSSARFIKIGVMLNSSCLALPGVLEQKRLSFSHFSSCSLGKTPNHLVVIGNTRLRFAKPTTKGTPLFWHTWHHFNIFLPLLWRECGNSFIAKKTLKMKFWQLTTFWRKQEKQQLVELKILASYLMAQSWSCSEHGENGIKSRCLEKQRRKK